MKRISILILMLLAFVSITQAPSLTVTPASYEPGEIERGETKTFNIYIQPRNVEGPITVSPSVEGPFFDEVFGSNSDVDSNRVSEEDIENWINFDQQQYTVNPENSQSYTLSDGTEVTASKVIEAEISVPSDAEPGFHAGKIGYAVSQDRDSSFSTTNWILPYTQVRFEVPGNAERDLRLRDEGTRMIRIGENRAQIIAMIENTGTVTTTFDGATLNILDENGRKVGEVETGSFKLGPDGSERFQEVSMVWESENLEAGTYEIDGTGDFITGRFYMNAQDAIEQGFSERVEVEEPGVDSQSSESDTDIPTWLVMMILILLGIIMYSFDIDPLWIVLIVGILAITAFVLMTGLPLYLIGITLILGFVMIYYGVV